MALQGESRRGKGLWKDEQRSPGYLPNGKRAPFALLVLLGVGILWRAFSRDIPIEAMSVFVILIGLGAFWHAAHMNEQRLRKERYIRGPGWWIGWLVSKTSVGFARGFHIVLGVMICTLGVVVLLRHV